MIRVNKAIWICLHFEYLALEIFADRDIEQPTVVVDLQHVWIANRDILVPGMALNTAYALCPDLKALERQPAREYETLEQLAHWAYRITAEVVAADNNCLMLEIGSCQRMYGDLTALLPKIRDDLSQRGHSVTFGLAHTPKAAWLLAQSKSELALIDGTCIDTALLEQQLNAVPVAILPIELKKQTRLLRMGLETLGQVMALPLAGLGKRFGVEFALYLQQMRGDHPDPQPPFVPQAVFQQSVAFVDGIHQRQTLLFPMKRLILSLCDFLTARQFYCRAFVWRFYDAHRLQAEMTIDLSRAQNRWRTFLELSQLKLDSIPLTDAVYTLTLHSEYFLEAMPGALTLFDDHDSNAEAGNTLIDRLASRLGHGALFRLSATESLWPESASRLIPVTETSYSVPIVAGERPLWLLPEPAPIREHDMKLFWQKPLKLLRGPERIEGPIEESIEVIRDYYIAQESDGRLCWIFRELQSGRWFVHGLFA
jgi:protein ImuB